MSRDSVHIIKRPLITEKTSYASSEHGRYSFVVANDARKPQIKAAIEELYGVRVKRVATQVNKGSYFRTRFGPGKTSDWKKATVQLHEDDRIELF